tara:strand:- start:1577 stop:1816 length:240 start_codon:yes stop_codon:yes gene_type:complete
LTEPFNAKDQTHGFCRSFMGHLNDVGMNWFAHLITAWGMAAMFLLGSVRLLVHGLLPFVDVKAGQNTVANVRRRMGHGE